MRIAFVFTFLVVSAACVEAQRNPIALESKRSKEASTELQSDNSAADNVRLSTLGPESATFELPLEIISKPTAKWPDQSRGTVCIQGSVLLKVEFLANGTIGSVLVVRGLPYGASENAIDSARKIIFVPRIKGGEKVDTTRVVEYRFSIY